ncbi:hypothetical protein [Streptomyces sp. NPDC058045]|uniref:hypothetical protein n=1 Tax=Streptomyces sp. NPDC058045 TaxID=3346311 RepID=UPI0036E0B681
MTDPGLRALPTGDSPAARGAPSAVPPRPAAALRRAAPALLGFAAVRALGVAVLAGWAAAHGKDWHTLLTARWDSLWYTRVAEHGYGWQVRLPDGTVHSNLAFFPLLPWLERLGAWIGPLPAADVGLVVAWTASVAAAWGIFAVAELHSGRRAAGFAVLLWAVLPVGVVQSMAYSESLFTALAAWGLYAVLTRRWLTAGVLAALAGLTRPVGGAVVAAVWVAVVLEAVRTRRLGWRPAVGALLAPLGAAGYVLWVGRRSGGGLLGYLDVQRQWGNGFDGGLAFARFIGSRLMSFPSVLAGAGLLAGVAGVVWLYARCVRERQPWPLLVYGGIVTVLALCASGYFGSKPRLLLPAFPLLLPLAAALARRRPGRTAALLAGVAAASAVYGAIWLCGSGPP